VKLEDQSTMSNKNVLAVFVVGLALLLAAFWAGLYLVGQQPKPVPSGPASIAGAADARSTQPVSTHASSGDLQSDPGSPDTRYIVQVSAYGTAEKANELVARLKKKYLAAYTQSPSEGEQVYRVCIGLFTAREQAQQIATELTGEGFKGVMIVPTKPH
jgi:cell division septation protein DedD